MQEILFYLQNVVLAMMVNACLHHFHVSFVDHLINCNDLIPIEFSLTSKLTKFDKNTHLLTFGL